MTGSEHSGTMSCENVATVIGWEGAVNGILASEKSNRVWTLKTVSVI